MIIRRETASTIFKKKSYARFASRFSRYCCSYDCCSSFINNILKDPMRLDCCDGHLCKKCFENVKMNSQNCPLCRAPNFTAKFSRLMVTVLSQYKLFCPAQECNESVPYANFAKHKKTCPVLNKKPCQQCDKFFSKDEFQEHFLCFEELIGRGGFNEEVVRRALRGLEAGMAKINFLDRN